MVTRPVSLLKLAMLRLSDLLIVWNEVRRQFVQFIPSTYLYLFCRNLSATKKIMNIAAQIAAATRPLVTFVCKLLDNFRIRFDNNV